VCPNSPSDVTLATCKYPNRASITRTRGPSKSSSSTLYSYSITPKHRQSPLFVLLSETSCVFCGLVTNNKVKKNKKSELMLLRRERAYSSSCSQLILVYLHPFHRNSLFAAKIAKKSLKNNILRARCYSRSSMLTFLRNSSPMLVMISSMSVPICNHFHARQANSE